MEVLVEVKNTGGALCCEMVILHSKAVQLIGILALIMETCEMRHQKWLLVISHYKIGLENRAFNEESSDQAYLIISFQNITLILQ